MRRTDYGKETRARCRRWGVKPQDELGALLGHIVSRLSQKWWLLKPCNIWLTLESSSRAKNSVPHTFQKGCSPQLGQSSIMLAEWQLCLPLCHHREARDSAFIDRYSFRIALDESLDVDLVSQSSSPQGSSHILLITSSKSGWLPRPTSPTSSRSKRGIFLIMSFMSL